VPREGAATSATFDVFAESNAGVTAAEAATRMGVVVQQTYLCLVVGAPD
jgi:hypothetical protein